MRSLRLAAASALGLPAAALLALPAPVTAGGQLYLLGNAPPVWQDARFPIAFNVNPGSAVGNIAGADPAQQFVDAVAASFQSWQDVPTARITFQRGPDQTALLDQSPDDGVHLMVFNNRAVVQGITIPLPAGVLGVTDTVFVASTGAIRGGAITLNTDPLPDNPNPDYETTGAFGSIDVEAIMLHEAGHFIGLSHSAVRNDLGGDLVGQPSNAAVMFPFLGDDVADGRVPDADDVAWVSKVYPEPSYATTFGAVSGTVPYGQGGGSCGGGDTVGAHGAHVVARKVGDPVGGEPRMIVGTYAYKQDGANSPWTIPGLTPGQYEIWIEPLDGSPVDALQVNTRIQFGSDKDFPEDWYSGAAENGNEGAPNSPATAVPVNVVIGSTTGGIEIDVDDAPNLTFAAIVAAPFAFALASRLRRRRTAQAG